MKLTYDTFVYHKLTPAIWLGRTVNMNAYRQACTETMENAHCLPFEAYTDEHVYQQEKQTLFQNEWVVACAEVQLPEAGDYFAFDLAGEPVVIIRKKSGALQALSNVCRHRGTPLLDDGFGSIAEQKGNIVCPYHAWTYSDEGQLKGVPFSGDAKVDKATHCLGKYAVDTALGLVFVYLGEAPYPLKERFEGLDEFLNVYEPQRFTQGYVGSKENWQCNWKLAMENAMESYHLFKVHKDTLEPTTPSKQAFHVAGSSEWSLTGGKINLKQNPIAKWLSPTYPEAYEHYLLVSLPPNFVGVITYDSFAWIQVFPTSATTCEIRSGGLTEGSSARNKVITDEKVEEFLKEDKWICERVMKGMRSSLQQGGKLVSMEKILVEFRAFIGSRMFGLDSTEYMESEPARIFLGGR